MLKTLTMKLILILCLTFLSIFCTDNANAGELNLRLENFPKWEKLTEVQPAVGDLIYPQWMKGEWFVKSTLVDLVAPLAPDIVTPGFESNRQYLDVPVSFKVRFVEQSKMENLTRHLLQLWEPEQRSGSPSYRTPLSLLSKGEGRENRIPLSLLSKGEGRENRTPLSLLSKGEGRENRTPLSLLSKGEGGEVVIADRAYNGLNLARAVLGNNAVKAVKVDPDSPNRQITFLQSRCVEEVICDRQLISIVKNRATENTADGRFIATEVFKQLFKGGSRPYINSVESTTAYRLLSTSSISEPAIEANQVTAVYLSSQDPDYFKARLKPVALYRYRLEFFSIR